MYTHTVTVTVYLSHKNQAHTDEDLYASRPLCVISHADTYACMHQKALKSSRS
jgi:hypothetical protein